MKNKIYLFLLIAIISITLIACSGVSQKKYDEVTSNLSTSKEQNNTLSSKLSELEGHYDSLKKDYYTLEEKCKNYESIIEPYKELSEAEVTLKAKEKKKKLKELELEEATAKAKKKAVKEAEEKKGYNTRITFDQLARTPDKYLLKKVKFTGKAIQVIEDSEKTQIRLAVNSDYGKIILIEYKNSLVKSRVLTNDKITIYGISNGLISYQSTLGGNITIPSVQVEKIDQ